MKTNNTQAHIITHTHWDREWFLTSVYTSQWIAGLIDKIEELSIENPDYAFLLDGQTLIIEDLLHVAPDYQERVERLIQNGNLIVGPYYCQPDWQLTNGETLIRNLQYGRMDVQKWGGTLSDTGWLVDTFGHISQAPQIHQLFGIDSVFVWRGVPQLAPFFDWVGSNQRALFAIDLFGGYRNLYGVSHVPEVASQRLVKMVERLMPYYATGDIPLFDGYDLEDNPEDPIQFYKEHAENIPNDIDIIASTPMQYAKAMREQWVDRPQIQGELNSGKYGATFPGTVSARTYLKIMAHDTSRMLYQLCEPIATLAYLKGRDYDASKYEQWTRALLQNAVHDCICGVSIDQVHEKMAYTYEQVFDAAQEEFRQALDFVLQDFSTGTYTISTNPYRIDQWLFFNGHGYHVQTNGVGVSKIIETYSLEDTVTKSITDFAWKNTHYNVHIHADGTIQIDDATLGRIVVYADNGDTYSDERGDMLGIRAPTDTFTLHTNSKQQVIHFPCEWQNNDIHIMADVKIYLDDSPMIRWTIDLDSQGKNFQVDLVFETAQQGTIFAGMPFDIVERNIVDNDLLPRELDADLSTILLGQREIGETRTFPMQEFVGITNQEQTTLIMAKGIYGYQANVDGRISVSLRRSVEWLTEADLAHRVGDAGPFFYVPDARCERTVTHEFGLVMGQLNQQDCQRINAAFQNPPLIVEVNATGHQTHWDIFQADVPLSSLQVMDGHVLARVWNATDENVSLSEPMQTISPTGEPKQSIGQIAPHSIQTLQIDISPTQQHTTTDKTQVTPIPIPAWRVGDNHGQPNPQILRQLEQLIQELTEKTHALEAELRAASGNERYRIEHQLYARKRELREYQLSLRLNQLKQDSGGKLTRAYLYEPDEQVAKIGFELNRLRIKRRIYDYIVEVI